MNVYKIRVTGEVLETAATTRRVNVDGLVLTFGREPVYVKATKLPPQLADDPKLRIEAVDSAPAGNEVIDLKAERVQDPAADEELPGDEADLKAERVQNHPVIAEELPGDEADLKAERIQASVRKRR